MRRILAGVLASLFLGTVALESFHRHAGQAPDQSCAVCAVSTQARQTASAAPVAAQSTAFVVVSAFIALSPSDADAVGASARAPPSAA